MERRERDLTTHQEPYVPFTAQQGLEPYDIPTLDENVTPHLAPYLRRWCLGILERNPKTRARMSRRMRLVLGTHPINRLVSMIRDKPDMLLNIAHWLLTEGNVRADRVTELEQLLSEAGSAWMVDIEASMLRRRLSREEEDSLRLAVGPADDAAEHLKEAWTAAWRRETPSQVEAYDGAVKALEAILAPIVIPKNTEPRLGTIIRALEDKPEKWESRFRGPETVKAIKSMLDELWKTHGRHAEMTPNSLEQAQDAVTIAVAVVALVRRGFLTRVDDSH